MKNLIQVIQTPVRFYPEIGGVENHVYYLAKELVKKKTSVEVICAGDTSLPTEREGINITRLKSGFKITNTNITLSLPLTLLRSKFQIVHTHMPTPWTADWSVLIAKLRNKKSIITIHNDLQKSGFLAKLITDFYLNTIFRMTLTLVDKIIIVNPDWKNAFTYTVKLFKHVENKIIVIPNGVDTQLFKPGSKKDSKTILFVSVLDKHHKFKGFDYLLKALTEIKQSIPDIKLQVIGEGELKQTYQKMVKEMGLNRSVTFLGAKSQGVLPKYFSEATVFVLPSIHTEGYGIVLLEALACGTPVVTTSIAGVSKDIKEFRAGQIVAPADSEALAKAITKIMRSKTLQREQGKNGRKLVERYYSWNIVSDKVNSLYKEVLR